VENEKEKPVQHRQKYPCVNNMTSKTSHLLSKFSDFQQKKQIPFESVVVRCKLAVRIILPRNDHQSFSGLLVAVMNFLSRIINHLHVGKVERFQAGSLKLAG